MPRRAEPAGTTPWDRWHGARVGGFVGVILAVLPAIWIDGYPIWLVMAGGAVGAGVGYVRGRSPG